MSHKVTPCQGYCILWTMSTYRKNDLYLLLCSREKCAQCFLSGFILHSFYIKLLYTRVMEHNWYHLAVNSLHRSNRWVWVLFLQLRLRFPVEVQSPVKHSPDWPLGGIVLEGLPVYHIHDGGHHSGPAHRPHINRNSHSNMYFFFIEMHQVW